MILICTKTGRHWPARDLREARRMAHTLGLTDYEIEPEARA